jgi:imidazolonepropionase-like amidohydrolase
MIAIRAGTLIDGTGAPPRHDMMVLVEGERITAVRPAAQGDIDPAATTIDATDRTVMPGMIDVHVHVHTPGGSIANYALAEGRQSQGLLALKASAYVRRALRMGFTTLRSLSSPAYIDVALRDAIDQGFVEGPRLRVAGQGLSITGGHMDEAHWAPEVNISGRTGVCDGPWESRKAVRVQCKRGVDLIKINACSAGVSQYTVDPPWVQEMTFEEMEAICDEAHKLLRPVAAHTSGGQGITDAIRAGVDSLEHAHWLTDEQIDMMAEQGTFYVPTLIVNSLAVALGPDQWGIPEKGWAWLLKANEDKWRSLEKAKAAGVKIVTGSDAGFQVDHGDNATELEELVKGGFTPMEAIVAATARAAECVGLAQDTGTIDAGKYADLVIVDGDPLSDIRILQQEAAIDHVMKGGRFVHRPDHPLEKGGA